MDKDTIIFVTAIINLIIAIIAITNKTIEIIHNRIIKGGGKKDLYLKIKPIISHRLNNILLYGSLAILIFLFVIWYKTVCITDPSEDQIVEKKAKITGKLWNINIDEPILLVIYSESRDRFYPECRYAIKNNNKWEATVNIGTENQEGETFVIYVLVLDDIGQKEHKRYCDDLSAHGSSNLSWHKIYDRVTVKRR